MPPVASEALGLPVEVLDWEPPLLALHRALATRLQGDDRLRQAFTTVAGEADGAVSYRPEGRIPTVPSVTFTDFGGRPDVTVPLWERTVQVDTWATTAEDADRLAALVTQVLHGQGLPVRGLSVQALHLVSDVQVREDPGNLWSRKLTFRLLAYER